MAPLERKADKTGSSAFEQEQSRGGLVEQGSTRAPENPSTGGSVLVWLGLGHSTTVCCWLWHACAESPSQKSGGKSRASTERSWRQFGRFEGMKSSKMQCARLTSRSRSPKVTELLLDSSLAVAKRIPGNQARLPSGMVRFLANLIFRRQCCEPMLLAYHW